MPDYLDKIITKKKDGTQIASVPLQDADAQTRLGTVEGKISTALTPISGNPISVSGLKSTQLAVEPVITFEPIQDLHGQSKPYPAGGGKNLIPMTVDGIKAANTTGTWSGNVYTISSLTFTILVDNANNVTGVKVNGTSSTSIAFMFTDYSTLSALGLSIGGSYLLNGGMSSTINLRLGVQGSGPEWTSVSTNDTTVNITSESESKLYRYQYVISGQISNVTLTPMLRLATISDNTFVPYSNISPISGYDKIEVLSCGVNVWDEETRNGYYLADGSFVSSASELCTKNKIPIIPSRTYYLRIPNPTSSANAIYVCEYNKMGTFIRRVSAGSISGGGNGVQYTSSLDAYFIQIDFNTAYGGTYNHNISVNYPATDTDYHPYHKTTDLSEALGQTVYGATWYPRTGKLLSNMILTNLKGKTAVTYGDDGIYISNVLNRSAVAVQGICSHALVKNASTWQSGDMLLGSSNATLYWKGILSILGKTLSEFNTWLASNDVWVCYDAGSDTEIQLTPHEISLLKDYAYVSTNGTSIALDYHNGEMASLGDVESASERLDARIEKLENHTLQNNMGTSVDLSEYSSSSNKYTFPNDGYVMIQSNELESGVARVPIYGANNGAAGYSYMNIVGKYQIQSTYVRKGMKCFVMTATSGTSITFQPFI